MKVVAKVFLPLFLVIVLISACHSNSEPVSNDPDMSPEELQQLNTDILKAFCQLTENDYGKIGDQLSVRHYWHKENTYAVYIDGLDEYEQTLTSVLIYSKEWLFPTTQPLYIYYEGSCTALKNALASGSQMGMGQETMTDFHEYHKSQNSKLYDPENWPEKAELSCPALLTSQKRAQIEAAFGCEFFGTDVWWFTPDNPVALRYYGTYNGYDILFEAGQVQVVSTQFIADSTFRHGSSFRLFAHKDGDFFELADLYGDGLVSKENIAKIAKLHEQCYGES